MEILNYELEHSRHIDGYYMSEEQLDYSSHPRDIIERDKYRYYLVGFESSIMTNFLALKEGADGEVFIKGLSTDGKYLNLGYGQLFLEGLIKYIRDSKDDIVRISLEVWIANKPAIKLYRKLGFVEGKLSREGRKGRLIYMYMDIGREPRL